MVAIIEDTFVSGPELGEAARVHLPPAVPGLFKGKDGLGKRFPQLDFVSCAQRQFADVVSIGL